MDYDLPLLFSSLQKDKEWKSVEVSGSMIANPGVYNLKANGLFIYLCTPTSNSNILFIPNYIPIPDSNARKPTAHLQCLLIPKIRHTFVFTDQNQVMNFVNYIYKSNTVMPNFIKKVDMIDYLVGDQITGIIPATNQKLTELMIISQVQIGSIIFQAHIINEDGILPGLTYTFSRNSFVSPIYEIPKSLKKEKNILTRSFALFSIDNPKDASIFIAKNESEMIRFVMAFYVSIMYSSNLKPKSISKLLNLNNGEQQNQNENADEIDNPNDLDDNLSDKINIRQRKESLIKRVLDDQYSFFEILEKIIFSEKVNKVSIGEIQRIGPISYSQNVDYRNFLTQPSAEEANLEFEFPSDFNENFDLNYNIISDDQVLFDENYNQFNLECLQHQENLNTFALIEQLGNNNDPIKDIEIIEKVLNNGIKNEIETDGAWKVFLDISKENPSSKNIDELDNLAIIVNQLNDSENKSSLRKCKTLLQDLIRIGIEEKILHLWILLTTSYKEIVQKYFNEESTLLNASEVNYCAFSIYNFIK